MRAEPSAAGTPGGALRAARTAWLTHAASFGPAFWCLVATSALLPAYVVRWHVGFYPTTLLEVAILVTVAAYAVELWRARALPDLKSPFLLPAGVFVLAGLVSVAVSPGHTPAAGLFRAYIVEPLLLFVVVSG